MIDRELQVRHPSEPWLWRNDWAERRVHHSHLRDGVALLLFAIVWNALCLPIAFLVLRGEHPLVIKIVLGIFAALAPLLLYGGIRGAIVGARHGRSTLMLNEVPLRLGRRLGARVLLARLPEGEIWTSLSCFRRPNGSRRHEQKVWSEERQVTRSSVQQLPEGLSVPVEFDLPAHGLQTELTGPATVEWALQFSAGGEKNVPVIRAWFPIPVFGGREAQAAADGELEALLAQLPEDVRQRIEQDIAEQ